MFMTSFSAKNLSCLKSYLIKKKNQIFDKNMPFISSSDAKNALCIFASLDEINAFVALIDEINGILMTKI